MIELVEKTETETLKPDLVDIYYKNDNKTTFDFVIFSIVKYFNKSPQEAILIATQIHENGEGKVAENVLKSIAKTKIKNVTQIARQEGFPLEVFYKDCR